MCRLVFVCSLKWKQGEMSVDDAKLWGAWITCNLDSDHSFNFEDASCDNK